MTNEDVIRMTQQGVAPAVIAQAIQSSRAVAFQVTPEDQPSLASAGVPRSVVVAMIERVMRDAARSSSYVADAPAPSAATTAPTARQHAEPRPRVVKEFPGLRAGQPEVAGGLTIGHGAGFTKAGVAVDGGISLHPRFTGIGEYNYTPVESGSALSLIASRKYSYKLIVAQGGGRVNILTRGRVVPYVAGTAGIVRESLSASAKTLFGSFSDSIGQNYLCFGGGGGLIVRATSHIDVKADFRELKGKDTIWISRVTMGVGYRF